MSDTMYTNLDIVQALELPESIITDLQTAQGTDFSVKANQFLTALVNKIVYQVVESVTLDNPFKKYDGFPVRYGDTIENLYVHPAKGYKFNPEAVDPFTKKKPEVISHYVSINYDLQYEVTIEDSLLRRAVLNEYGFMNLIDELLGSLRTGMVWDEYFSTLAMLNNPNIYAGGIEEVALPTDKKLRAEGIMGVIYDTVKAFKLPSTNNNKANVPQTTSLGNILMIAKASILKLVDLDYLAGVYNLSKVELLKNIIEVSSFQVMDEEGVTRGEDIDFVILDERGFDNHTALEDGGMIYNPKGKYTNHFANLWKIVSYKLTHNARAFKITDSEQA